MPMTRIPAKDAGRRGAGIEPAEGAELGETTSIRVSRRCGIVIAQPKLAHMCEKLWLYTPAFALWLRCNIC